MKKPQNSLGSISMEEVLKAVKDIGLFSLFVYPAFKLFRWNNTFGVGIAVIPVIQYLQNWIKLPPVLGKILTLTLFVALMWVTWHFAEIIVALIAIAFVMEIKTVWSMIKAHIHKEREKNGLVVDHEVAEGVKRMKATINAKEVAILS